MMIVKVNVYADDVAELVQKEPNRYSFELKENHVINAVLYPVILFYLQ